MNKQLDQAPDKPNRPSGLEGDSALATSVKGLLARGEAAEARARFGDLVALHQRRACRIAYHYLRDAADADEAVQDAFVKTFGHLASFREDLPFGTWFTRILVNGCLDRLKARARRTRRSAELVEAMGRGGHLSAIREVVTPEQALLRRERRRTVAAALQHLPARQRLVFVLTFYDQLTFREISTVTGLAEATVRVHLFRAIRALRGLLVHEDQRRLSTVNNKRAAGDVRLVSPEAIG